MKLSELKVGDMAEILYYGERLNLKVTEIDDWHIYATIGMIEFNLLEIYSNKIKDVKLLRIETTEKFYDNFQMDYTKYQPL